MTYALWITWEDHRRSRELASILEATYFPLLHSGPRHFRYPILSWKTIRALSLYRPNVVFCQNPSIVLNLLLCLLKFLFKYKLVVDRHSNFKLDTVRSKNPKWIFFHFLSDFTLRNSDLTIVTNVYLQMLVEDKGGRAFILQDKLPTLPYLTKRTLKGIHNLVFISTFSSDEPIEEIISAAKLVGSEYHIYITGSYKRFPKIESLTKSLPKNVTLTGFLPEEDYQSLLYSADALIVITDQEHTLTCGAYEAVALEKPMILGQTSAIREYFYQGALYTDLTIENLAANFIEIVADAENKKAEVAELKNNLSDEWLKRFEMLQKTLKEFYN
jgi:glycosyltransferase involved in cell wall biosynthesis